MIRQRFVILDRDGTIIRECHYLSDVDAVELVPAAVPGLRMLREMDLGIVVVTNQSGLGRGHFDHDRLGCIHERMTELLVEEGVHLDRIYFCPHIPKDYCSCRKPEIGMIERAARELHFDPAKSFVIGDKPCDIELGRRVGATTLLVLTGHGKEYAEDPTVGADYVVDDLHAAAQAIRARLTQDALGARLKMSKWRTQTIALAAEAENDAAARPAYEPILIPDN